MSTALGALRRRILTPDISETRIDVRGFHKKDEATRDLLETVGSSFLTGFGYAAQASAPTQAETRLQTVPVRFRGFAYEGAAMCFAIRDALTLGSGRHQGRFAAGRGADHIYMVYVGIGWAMARLPRFLHRRLHTPDPVLRWLLLDGYGFHQAYFHTRRYVHEQYRGPAVRWPRGDTSGYSARAVDQGIGRAMWFVCGADVGLLHRTIAGFAPARRPDLYSGAGLAATYAGGASEDELLDLLRGAGEYAADLAQGSVFAASARIRAGLVTPHVEAATAVLCGRSAAQAADFADRRRPSGDDGGPLPAYGRWRRDIARDVTRLGQA